MQDRYTGDLGDFSKLGILRVLQKAGLSIGLNWYLTPDETHNSDGKYVKYLCQEAFKACDEASGKTKAERESFRRDWHKRAVAALSGNDIICVDPDNGLIVPSAAGKPKENKYVLENELADYYKQGSSVIYYQHKARKPDDFYICRHRELIESPCFPGAKGLALKFKTTSHRYYFFILQPRHQEIVEKAINEMLTTPWKEHFRRLS